MSDERVHTLPFTPTDQTPRQRLDRFVTQGLGGTYSRARVQAT